jgi:hypothetical protein
LVVNLALGGPALCLFVSRIEGTPVPVPRPTPADQAGVPSVVSTSPVAGQSAPPAAVVAVPVPVLLPSIAALDLSAHSPGGAPLAAVVGPCRRPGATGRAGTGFLVANDGNLLIAAHVVTDCGRTAIVLQFDRACHLLALRCWARHERPGILISAQAYRRHRDPQRHGTDASSAIPATSSDPRCLCLHGQVSVVAG